MTAAMLVLEPIFEADLPPEQYAYRPGRSAQQAVVDVEALVFRGHPEVVDADLADYFGSIPHAELLKSVTRRIVGHAMSSPGGDRPAVESHGHSATVCAVIHIRFICRFLALDTRGLVGLRGMVPANA